MKRNSTNAIIIHTTASNSRATPDSVINYHLNFLRWSKGGYHIIVDQSGKGKEFYDWRKNEATNGILPNPTLNLSNLNTIHITYVGGINDRKVNEIVCNISPEQENFIIEKIKKIIVWYPSIKIYGHNQVNSDRICPSFWVPDWLRAWGIEEKYISDVDPFNLKNYIKNRVPHPINFYKSRIKNICDHCGKEID